MLGDSFGQLVSAAGATTAAVIALEQISNCFGVLAFHKLADSSQISGAAAVKAYIVQLAVNYIKMNLAGADSAGFISNIFLSSIVLQHTLDNSTKINKILFLTLAQERFYVNFISKIFPLQKSFGGSFNLLKKVGII